MGARGSGRKAAWPPRAFPRGGIDYISVKLKNGKRREYPLGPSGSAEARAELLRIVTELEASGMEEPLPRSADLRVAELLVAYDRHARGYYASSRNFDKQMHRIHMAMRVTLNLYGHKPAREFGPLSLKAVRLAMARDVHCPWCGGQGNRVWKPPPSQHTDKPKTRFPKTIPCKPCAGSGKRGWSLLYLNACVGVIRRAFKWAVSQELIEEAVYRRLCTLPDLRPGEELVGKEEGVTVPVRQGRGKIRPPQRGAVEATLPFLRRQVRDMCQLMRLTGMREDEVVQLRPQAINRQGLDPDGRAWPGLWVFTPEHDKTMDSRVIGKVIFLGKRCQEILAPYLLRPAEAWCFSPAEAVAELRAEQRAKRKSKVQPSQLDRRSQGPQRAPGDQYDPHAIWRAVDRAAKKAGVAHWAPHQLRHEVGTVVRWEYDLEHARAALGHQSADVTLIYAEADLKKAAAVARKMG